MNNKYHILSVNSLGGESVVIVCHVNHLNTVFLADLRVRKIMAWMHVVVRSLVASSVSRHSEGMYVRAC